jgi:FixJ family two-component response regulator
MTQCDEPLVLIVDDDAQVRDALHELLMSVGIEAERFESPHSLVESVLPDRPGCIIMDVRMPGSSGLDHQRRLVDDPKAKPIVFLTGHGDVPMAVQAMKAGAIDFLIKPVRDQTFLDAVARGVATDLSQRERVRLVRHHLLFYATLTPREREVLAEIARGRLNKQMAFDLGISEGTVKLHRKNVMRKMKAATIGDLIRSWEILSPHLTHADSY